MGLTANKIPSKEEKTEMMNNDGIRLSLYHHVLIHYFFYER